MINPFVISVVVVTSVHSNVFLDKTQRERESVCVCVLMCVPPSISSTYGLSHLQTNDTYVDALSLERMVQIKIMNKKSVLCIVCVRMVCVYVVCVCVVSVWNGMN